MKRLQGEGFGSTKEQGILGDDSALDTIAIASTYFTLRSGQEHRQLRRDPCQMEVVEHPGERAYMKNTEDTSSRGCQGVKNNTERLFYTAPTSTTDRIAMYSRSSCT